MARRAAYLRKARADTLANLTVEAGNFTPLTFTRADSLKTRALLDFYRMEQYDAVTLSTREMSKGLGMWEQAAKDGAPIVVANLFADARGKKPIFKPYIVKQEKGQDLAVIGLISESVWNARKDTAMQCTFRAPHEMGKLIKKVAKKSDHLTVIGEFTTVEAETLASRFPEIDLIVTSGIKNAERARTVANTVIIGSSNRGYYGNYVDFAAEPTDSVRFSTKVQTLDESIPIDSSVQHFVDAVNHDIKTAPTTPANQPTQH